MPLLQDKDKKVVAIKYNVRGVPRIVINETIQIEGAVPEPMLTTQLQEAFKPVEASSRAQPNGRALNISVRSWFSDKR